MEPAGQESCSIQICQKGLNHVTGIKGVADAMIEATLC